MEQNWNVGSFHCCSFQYSLFFFFLTDNHIAHFYLNYKSFSLSGNGTGKDVFMETQLREGALPQGRNTTVPSA